MDYKLEYKKWLEGSFTDEKTKEALRQMSEDEVKESFYRDLEFGTAGLRGILGPGTNRMNKYVVARTALAISKVLKNHKIHDKGIVFGRDVRHGSKEFEELSCKIFAKEGIKTYIFDDIRPTPMLAYAVRYLKTGGGIMVTASHNPKIYNGYKVYWSEGSQILSDIAGEILGEIEKIKFEDLEDYLGDKSFDKSVIQIISKDFDEDYYKKTLDLTLHDGEDLDKDIKIVYTPLNGCGNIPVRHILRQRGFENLIIVKEQENPDPDFSTVSYPNPEFIEAFDLSKKYGEKNKADLIIATDPDSDRLAVLGKKEEGDYFAFSGNELAYLLVEYVLGSLSEKNKLAENSAIVRSLVSSDLVDYIAQTYKVKSFQSLTGFKNICNYANIWEKTGRYSFILGFEESIGYVLSDHLRDKDGVSAAMMTAEMAAYYKKRNLSLYDQLQNIYKKYAYAKSFLTSIVMEGIEGAEKIKRIMEDFRSREISEFGGLKTREKIDFIKGYKNIDSSNVLKYSLEDGSWFALRPSGTEPKIKVYIYTKNKDEKRAEEILQALKEDILNKIKLVKWGEYMILFCDFNPKLIRKYKSKIFNVGEENLIDASRVYASGYGIDMAVFANRLFQDSKVFYLKGTNIGKFIESDLRNHYIESTSISLKDDNIENIIIDNGEGKTIFKSKSPRITMEDKKDIINAFAEAIRGKKIVGLSIIDHDSLKDDLYEALINICYKENVKIVVNPENVGQIKDSKPYVLIMDKKDLTGEENITHTGDVPEVTKKLIDKGVGIVVVNSQRATVVSTKDKNYKVYFDKISDFKTYNKNLILAGFAIGIDRDYDLETTIKLAIASSICENYMKFSEVEMSEIKKLMNSVKVEEM